MRCTWDGDIGCSNMFCVCEPSMMKWKCAYAPMDGCKILPCLLPYEGDACKPWAAKTGDECDWQYMTCECTAQDVWHCDVKWVRSTRPG